jgi:hypothetical protein
MFKEQDSIQMEPAMAVWLVSASLKSLPISDVPNVFFPE